MDVKSGFGNTEDSLGINPVTVTPSPAFPPGHVFPGQASQVEWMPQPSTTIGCPPGLEYLTKLDQILVHQQVELLEMATNLETENKYQIKNTLGQQIYFAYEESDLWMRQSYGSKRGFTMHVVNNVNQEVIRVIRPFQCCAGCCWCAGCCDNCALTLTVEAPPGNSIGHIRQRGSKFSAHFDILDESFTPVLKIRGPCCICECASDIDFRLMTSDDSQQIGKITKQWSGLAKELYTDADNFCVTFPMDLNVKVKSTLLGALFLIDFVFFEQRPTKNTRRR